MRFIFHVNFKTFIVLDKLIVSKHSKYFIYETFGISYEFLKLILLTNNICYSRYLIGGWGHIYDSTRFLRCLQDPPGWPLKSLNLVISKNTKPNLFYMAALYYRLKPNLSLKNKLYVTGSANDLLFGFVFKTRWVFCH